MGGTGRYGVNTFALIGWGSTIERVLRPDWVGTAAGAVMLAGTISAVSLNWANLTAHDACSTYWVDSWLGSPQDSTARDAPRPEGGQPNDPPSAVGDRKTFSDQTLRMIVSPHVAGGTMRVELS